MVKTTKEIRLFDSAGAENNLETVAFKESFTSLQQNICLDKQIGNKNNERVRWSSSSGRHATPTTTLGIRFKTLLHFYLTTALLVSRFYEYTLVSKAKICVKESLYLFMFYNFFIFLFLAINPISIKRSRNTRESISKNTLFCYFIILYTITIWSRWYLICRKICLRNATLQYSMVLTSSLFIC